MWIKFQFICFLHLTSYEEDPKLYSATVQLQDAELPYGLQLVDTPGMIDLLGPQDHLGVEAEWLSQFCVSWGWTTDERWM